MDAQNAKYFNNNQVAIIPSGIAIKINPNNIFNVLPINSNILPPKYE